MTPARFSSSTPFPDDEEDIEGFDDFPATHLDDEDYDDFVAQEFDQEGHLRGDPRVGWAIGLAIVLLLALFVMILL